MNRCPECNIGWTACDDECCGGIKYCRNCGLEKKEADEMSKQED